MTFSLLIPLGCALEELATQSAKASLYVNILSHSTLDRHHVTLRTSWWLCRIKALRDLFVQHVAFFGPSKPWAFGIPYPGPHKRLIFTYCEHTTP